MVDEMAGAGLTAKERLERIEQGMQDGFRRLEDRLDHTASIASLRLVEERVVGLEKSYQKLATSNSRYLGGAAVVIFISEFVIPYFIYHHK